MREYKYYYNITKILKNCDFIEWIIFDCYNKIGDKYERDIFMHDSKR